MTDIKYPYFDYVLHKLSEQNAAMESAFGRHVHWGYWDNPAAATASDVDFAKAAERLTLELTALTDVEAGHAVLDTGFGGTCNFWQSSDA